MNQFALEVFGAQLVNSLAIGSIYAILVVGFNLLLLIGGIFQYAYPHLVVMSMYICWLVLMATNNNRILGILAAILASIVINLATEPLFRPLVKRKASVHTFVLSLGIATIAMDVMNRMINTGRPIAFPPQFSGLQSLVKVGIVTISIGQFLTIFGSIVAMFIFIYMLYRTKQGRAFRAMAQNLFVARVLGIPITRQRILSYAIAGLLGGISAVFFAMTLGSVWSTIADILALKVLVAVLLAGMGNLKGGLISAYIIGIIEGLSLAYLPGDWTNAIVFGFVIAIVIIKPKGLFGLRA